MHISIQNLGPVKKGEFDLKPLTVFIGDNRQGKTQTIYTATAMLDLLGYSLYCSKYDEMPSLQFQEINEKYSELHSKGNISWNINAFFREHGQEYLDKLSGLMPETTEKILGTSKITYDTAKFTYTLTEDDKIQVEKTIHEFSCNNDPTGIGLHLVKKKGEDEIFIYKTDSYNDKTPESVGRQILLMNILSIFHNSLFHEFVYLPSERNGAASYLQIAKNNRRAAISNNPQLTLTPLNTEGLILTGLPYPLQHFIALLSALTFDFDNMTSRRNSITPKEDIERYQKLASLLCRAVIGEEIRIVPTSTGAEHEIVIEKDGKQLDLPLASSGVKGLMSLALYLQYISQRGHTIVIDEPEENLHPTQQVKLAEFLAILVNNGINVAITTHSPYIVEHLETLIKAYGVKEIYRKESGEWKSIISERELNGKELADKLAEKLQLKRKDAFISPNMVGCYLFKDGTITDILDDRDINWQTFCDTANIVDDAALFTQGVIDMVEDEKRRGTEAGALAEEKGEYQQ